jgi:peptide/nickel transport system permease protein
VGQPRRLARGPGGPDRPRPHRPRGAPLIHVAGRLLARVAQAAIVVLVAATLAFVLLHLAPGDPFSSLGGEGITPELRDRWRALYGIDRPIWAQYVDWLGRAARGDLGRSITQHRPVVAILGDALPNTLLLMGLAFGASLLAGTALGAWQGARAGSRADRLLGTLSLVVYSLPEFWLALALMLLFVHWLHWLPATGMTDPMHAYLSPAERLLDRLRHLVLPWLSLTLVGTAVFARFQRAAMREVIGEPFVRTARAKGLSERAVRRQAWRAALLPVITLAGLLFPALLAGAVFVERVFSWPGMGMTLVRAITEHDYEVVAAIVVIGSAMTAAGSLLADVVRELADPRLRDA